MKDEIRVAERRRASTLSYRQEMQEMSIITHGNDGHAFFILHPSSFIVIAHAQLVPRQPPYKEGGLVSLRSHSGLMAKRSLGRRPGPNAKGVRSRRT